MRGKEGFFESHRLREYVRSKRGNLTKTGAAFVEAVSLTTAMAGLQVMTTDPGEAVFKIAIGTLFEAYLFKALGDAYNRGVVD